MIPPIRQYQLSTSLNIAAEVASTSCNSSKLKLPRKTKFKSPWKSVPSIPTVLLAQRAESEFKHSSYLLEDMVLQDHIPSDPKRDPLPLFLS